MEEEKEGQSGASDEANVGANKRSMKNIVVNRKLQFTLVGYFLLVAVQTVGFLFFTSLEKMNKLSSIAGQMNLDSGHPLLVEIQNFYDIMSLEFSSIVVLQVIFFFGFLYLSHKIAGPIYKFQKILRESQDEGQLKTVHFRKGDFFQDLSDEYNKVVEKFKS